MFNTKIISQHRNDYTATMECEHCGSSHVDKYGYDDSNYHDNVIPKMYCKSCDKNRAGELKQPSNV